MTALLRGAIGYVLSIISVASAWGYLAGYTYRSEFWAGFWNGHKHNI